MSGVREQSRKRRTPKTFLISTDLRVQDDLEGTIWLKRGYICVEQDSEKSRGDYPWVKVLDNGFMVKLERKFLLEVPSDLIGLLEPVQELEGRLNLSASPAKLQQLASLPLLTPLWVQIGQPDELAEAELKYVGPLTRGSSGVFFGVQLIGSAMGRGHGNGSLKGQRFFSCPEDCALFVPVSHIRTRYRSGAENNDPRDRPRDREHHRGAGNPSADEHRSNNHQARGRHVSFHQRRIASPPQPLNAAHPRTGEPPPVTNHARAPSSPTSFRVGQRVCYHADDAAYAGEVRFCGLLPGRSSSSVYVGILLDTPHGNWNGVYKGEKLCHIPSEIYGVLVAANKVSPVIRIVLFHHTLLGHCFSSQKVYHPSPPQPNTKSILKPPLPKPTPASPSTTPPKVALLPPPKLSLKLPPLPPPKPPNKIQATPPAPPPKPQRPASPVVPEEPYHNNGAAGPPSPGKTPDPEELSEEEEDVTPGSKLEVGSMVEVNDPPLYGVIRWIGEISGIAEPVAGIELDQELSAGTDGSYLGERRFRCSANKGLFVKLRNCRRDSRFPEPETPVNQVERCNSIAFAEWGSEHVEEHTAALFGDEAKDLYHGRKRGIQGHLNSCYLDSTLFSLFSCCDSADWVLFQSSEDEDDQNAKQAQELLRCDIVNPLRRYGYVCASKTMALRRLLEAANSDSSFTNQEKDPEEFLNKLFQLLEVEPLLKIRSLTQQPQEGHLYQLFPPTLPATSPASPLGSPVPLTACTSMRVASVQALLESSFLHARLKFVEAPSCLLLLMPRFGKDFKMFDAILPTLELDITDLLDDTLRLCSICQTVAEWECLQCYEDLDITPGRLKQYCHTCNTQVHTHKKRASHSPVKMSVPEGPWSGTLHSTRRTMSLFAVTCIETSHYVSFVKHGPEVTDWLFFDSMADREGGENGFNIPIVKACPEVGRYLSLSEEELSRVNAASLRESVRRLLCDSYMCLYHSPELSLYK